MVPIQSAAVSPKVKQPKILEEPYDFSLVMGGPTFQLLRKSRLVRGGLELMHRRILAIATFVWLPLLLLTVFTPRSDGLTSFFYDVEVHVRFLVSLPVLIAAELLAHSRIRFAVRAFVDRRIVLPADVPRFHGAIDSAARLRNSVPLELALLVLVYTVGLWVWNGRVASNTSTWYALTGGRWQLTLAGYWYVFISIPLFQFILLRWYMRMLIWSRFLWQVSKMNLNLIPTHPDRCAGLAFLGKSTYAFGPILFAQGAVLAGIVASRVLNEGQNLLTFKMQALGFVVFFVAAILAPLLVFTPKMTAAKRLGLDEYGMLAQRYVEKFHGKWVRGDSSEELLGTSDIQSLADLGNSYDIIRDMPTVPIPFGLRDICVLGAAAAMPLIPLLLIVFSPEELLARILKMVF